MSSNDQYNIEKLDLTDGEYTITQSLVRNKYELTDSDGEVVLKGKQGLFKLKEKFPFVTGDGEEAFVVEAQSVIDVAGSYTLIDSATEDEVVVLDEDMSLFTETWTVRDPDTGDSLASIESQNKLVAVARSFSAYANILPNKYDIFDPDGNKIGSIEGQFSVKDTYDVSLEDTADVPTEAVMSSACVIDALENN